MIRGVYSNASGMTTSLRQMNVIGNNLANVNSTAYKEKQNVFKAFPETDLVRTDDQGTNTPLGNVQSRPKLGSMAMGVSSDGTYTSFKQGSLRDTGNPLDVALEGKGFMTVQMPDGERAYTRDGKFKINGDNQLVTANGRRILGRDGEPIQLTEKQERITITPDGKMYDKNHEQFAQLRVVQFENPQKSKPIGDNLYKLGENNSINYPPEDVKVRQGTTERPNFSPVKQMTRMIDVSKRYNMNAKALKSQSKSLSQALSSVAK